MTNDREYLQLAAKAAGYVLVWGDKYKLGDDEIDCTDIPYIRSGQPDEGDIFWNPLTDDGDALRLAVKLGLLIDTQYNNGVGVGSASFEEVWESTAVEPYAATRRAIVRAAAEIGKEMK